MTQLHALLEGLPIRRSPMDRPAIRDLEIVGLCHDSRRVRAGDLYVALVGARFDGRVFCADAAARGAVAVLGAGEAPGDLDLPWIGVDDPRSLLGPLAARIHGAPHERLTLVGVTGTNGKSTVVRLIAAMLEHARRPTGTLGTLGYHFAGRDLLAEIGLAGREIRTTPEAPDFFRALAEMERAGADAAVMEVSSHALALGRVDGAAYDLAVFTNLTQDHLDFHGDLDTYFEAKARLFAKLKPGGRAIIPVDDPWGRRLLKLWRMPHIGYGIGGAVDVASAELDAHGLRARLTTPRGPLDIVSPLLGRFNLRNILTAVAAAEALELPHAAIRAALAAERPLPGRLEPVDAGQDFPALVDYAHTPDALRAALESTRELASGRRLTVVFGCGGDRDRSKRPIMGRIAGELADLPILTSDNPRSEDPEAILADVEAGLRESGRRPADYSKTADRRQAIRRAVDLAVADLEGDGWAVLVAGKGHEATQTVGDRVLAFSDRDELFAALARHGFAPPASEHHEEAHHG